MQNSKLGAKQKPSKIKREEKNLQHTKDEKNERIENRKDKPKQKIG